MSVLRDSGLDDDCHGSRLMTYDDDFGLLSTRERDLDGNIDIDHLHTVGISHDNVFTWGLKPPGNYEETRFVLYDHLTAEIQV